MADASPFLKLPSELLDEIICAANWGCRRQDTMKASSLVNRDWSPYARRHLFQSFTFPPDNLGFAMVTPAWLDLATESPENIDLQSFTHKMESFMADLQYWPLDSSMSLATIVRNLTINGMVWPSIRRGDSSKLLPWPQGLLSQLPFTRLKRLHLCRITKIYSHTIDSGHMSLCRLLVRNPSLETIVMETVRLDSVEALVQLLYDMGNALAPSFKSLSMIDIDTSDRWGCNRSPSGVQKCLDSARRRLESLPIIHNPLRLQSLKFSDFCSGILGDVISATLIKPPWRLFDLSFLQSVVLTHRFSCWKFYRDIFMACGSTITSLKVDVWAFDLKEDIGECFGYLVNLDHLELRLDCTPGSPGHSVDSGYPMQVVNTCLPPLPKLEHLSVIFRVAIVDGPVLKPGYLISFSHLEPALSVLHDTITSRFKLKSVNLRIKDWGNWDELNEDDARECLLDEGIPD
ncbi:hypothetical protein K435DRAFT_973471 [Dendrothele bispora CBS 962.96]|uniref:F-box domain-containing protein n=1 Tax=Dendrothele bispora (strain CBS 962.96) TaxID=1314807 RepID=A0A4S8KS49_DENBC|nr:hypothetical protein K435DRAFT_973471 [Dendrothele bispora CBS 962.96]